MILVAPDVAMGKPYPPSAKRTAAQRESDLVDVGKMILQGLSMHQIADNLNEARPYCLTRQTIQKDVKLLSDRWKEKQLELVNQAKMMQLRKIRLIEADTWERLKESDTAKRVSKQTVRTGQPGQPGQQSTATVETEERLKDPRWHAILLKCLEREAALLGLDAPKQIEKEGNLTLDGAISHEQQLAAMEKHTEIRVLRENNLLPWRRDKRIGPGTNHNDIH